MNYSTGAIKDKRDKRDFKFSDIAFALPPFDWDKGFDIENEIGQKLTVKNQNGSGSCGGQAWSYYGQALDKDLDEKSAKFIYSQTFIPPAGSAGRTNCDLVIKKGWGTEKLTPSYPATEIFMQNKEDITPVAYAQALTDKALSYANVDINIESIAQAIKECSGCIIGITGKNNGTWTSAFPTKPDKLGNDCWNHWIYCGKVKIENGIRYIGFLNSWGEDVGENGWQWLTEDYIKYPYVWSAWTLVYNFPKFIFTKTLKLGMTNDDVKELQKKLGIMQTGFFWILTKNAVIKYQKSKGLIADGIVGIKTMELLNR